VEIRDGSSEQHGFKVVRIGEVGELVVGGYQIANGYINRPEQTNEAFVSSPFGLVYRTGDKAKITSDGRIECLGRISDGQVKLRGQRIELGEIEQALLRSPGCHSAIAQVIGTVLVVFCAMDDGISAEEANQRVLETCRSWLPTYMMPGDLVFLREMPRLASGKVDRKRLKADYKSTSQQAASITNGWTDDGKEIAAVISELTGSSVALSATLSSSGIDSLLAIRLAASLRGLGYEIGALEILSSQTLSDLLAIVAKKGRMDGGSPHASTVTRDSDFDGRKAAALEAHPSLNDLADGIECIRSCTAVQIAMLAETAQNPAAYCNLVDLEFPHGCEDGGIHTWMTQVMNDNDILRSGFIHSAEGFERVVFKALACDCIRVVESLTDSFELRSENDFLRPLFVEVKAGNGHESPRARLFVHHALYDGWSVDLLLSDLSALSMGTALGKRPQFGQVVDFYGRLSDRKTDAARSFWAEHLLGWQKTPFPKLSSNSRSSSAISVTVRTLSIHRDAIFQSFSKTECSTQVLFQACLTWLLGAITGTNDVVIGSITSGRTIPVPGIDGIIGPCIASTPLRINLSGMRTIRDLVNSLHVFNRAILEHCILPLSEIKRASGLSPGEALYDVLFVYQESLASRSKRHNPVREISHQDFLETAILVEVEPLEESFRLSVTYHQSIITSDVAELFTQQFDSLLSHFARNLSLPLTSAETCFDIPLLSVHNITPNAFSKHFDLARAFEETALKWPSNDAIRFADSISADDIRQDVLSYDSLNRQANKIARYLQGIKVNLGDVVAIVMQKSPLLYATILAIVKSGCAYLPLLPSTPIARIQTVLSQAQVSICLSDAASQRKLRDIEGTEVYNVQSTDMSKFGDGNLLIGLDLSRLAYVIYTSGTTGVPKGVAVTQLNIMSNIDVLSRIYPVGCSYRLLQSCSQAFDVSVFEIFFTWLNGMCLCSGTNDTIFQDLELSIRKFEVTHLSMTPTVASLVHPKNVPRVEFLVTAGEPMTPLVAKQWNTVLYQGYGPSETTNICSVKKMTLRDHIEHLGWALENTSTMVLYPHSLDVVPLGCVGELCFGGDQIADGYLNMPELTSQKFLNHPIYGRIYRSGDLGRMLPDKTLIILGRIDDQLKLRGQRIESNEIDTIILSSGLASTSTAIVSTRGESGSNQLATFYVPLGQECTNFAILPLEDKTQESITAMATLLQCQLPSYMVPSYLLPITTIPRTSSGKIDKTLLQATFAQLTSQYLTKSSTSCQREDQDTEWTANEQKVAGITSAVLRVERQDIGRWTPLAALGLDSISAIALAQRLRKLFGVPFSVSQVLRNPSVAQLARSATTEDESSTTQVDDHYFSDKFLDTVTANFREMSGEIESVLPCTPLQEAMLAATNEKSYVNWLTLLLHLPPEALQAHWEEMTRRHGILRTCFVTTSDSQRPLVQVVLRRWSTPWLIHTDTSISPVEVADLQYRHMPQPIDSQSPPIRLMLYRDGTSIYLSLLCHHVICDGVAMEVLFSEIEELSRGQTLPPALEYAKFLQHMLSLPENVGTYWTDHFRDFESVSFAASHSGTDEDHVAGGILTRRLDMALSEVECNLRRFGWSLLALWESVWSVVLSILLRREDLCFGLVMSGRSIPIDGIERLVAPCFNTIPIRARMSTFKQQDKLVRHFQASNPTLLHYQFTPLRYIQALVNNDGQHLFDTLLLLQHPLRQLDPNVWERRGDIGGMDIPLVCEVIPSPLEDSLLINLHYDG
jgi:ferricrocin synthase